MASPTHHDEPIAGKLIIYLSFVYLRFAKAS